MEYQHENWLEDLLLARELGWTASWTVGWILDWTVDSKAGWRLSSPCCVYRPW